MIIPFDKESEIGRIRLGDVLFGSVCANVLKPVEGDESEQRHIT